jgi:hypothetical protein
MYEIGGFKVSDAIGSGGANTLGRARGQRHSPYYFLLGVKSTFAQFVEFLQKY